MPSRGNRGWVALNLLTEIVNLLKQLVFLVGVLAVLIAAWAWRPSPPLPPPHHQQASINDISDSEADSDVDSYCDSDSAWSDPPSNDGFAFVGTHEDGERHERQLKHPGREITWKPVPVGVFFLAGLHTNEAASIETTQPPSGCLMLLELLDREMREASQKVWINVRFLKFKRLRYMWDMYRNCVTCLPGSEATCRLILQWLRMMWRSLLGLWVTLVVRV